MASAKGVRLEKSKLRGNLDIFTYGEYAVISSKDFGNWWTRAIHFHRN